MWHDPDRRLDKAVERFEEGDLAAARAMFRALDRQGVISPRIDLYLGHCHLEEDQPQAALRRYRRAAALARRDAAAWVGIALCHGRLGRVDRALEALARAARLEPDREEIHCHLVHCHALMGRLDDAEDHAARAIQLDPECPHVHRHLAVAYQLAGRPRDALVRWSEVQARDPEHPEADVGAGRCLLRLERRAEARRRFLTALERGAAADGHVGLGELALLEGRSEEAVDHFRRALEVEADHVEARLHLVGALSDLGADDAAWEALDPLGPGDSGDVEVGALAARLLADGGRRTDAVRLLRRLVARDPQAPEAWHALGELLARLDRLPAARTVLGRALRLEARWGGYPPGRAARTLARVLGRVGEARRAVSVVARAAHRHPREIELHLDVAAAQLARGRNDAAERALARGLAASPFDPSLHAASAELAMERGHDERARDHLRVALRAHPRHGGALALLVRWLIERGAWTRAVNAARAALRVLPMGHAAGRELGHALVRAGRAEEAVLALRRYVLASPGDCLGYRLLAEALEAHGDVRAARAQRRLEAAVGTLA